MKRFFRRLIGRWLGYEDGIMDLMRVVWKFEDHVDSNASFRDSAGNSNPGTYNSEEVAAHWHKYHNLRQEMAQKLRDVLNGRQS